MDILRDIETHLQTSYPHGQVGGTPDNVPDGAPWFQLWGTDIRPPAEANDIDTTDVALRTIVQVKVFGYTFRQTSDLAGLLDATIRDGLTVAGEAVQLVQRERASGPTRDDAAHPQPGLYAFDLWYAIDHAPDLATS